MGLHMLTSVLWTKLNVRAVPQLGMSSLISVNTWLNWESHSNCKSLLTSDTHKQIRPIVEHLCIHGKRVVLTLFGHPQKSFHNVPSSAKHMFKQ